MARPIGLKRWGEKGQDGGGGVWGMVEDGKAYSGYLPAYMDVFLYFNNIIALSLFHFLQRDSCTSLDLKIYDRAGIFPSCI